MAKVLLINALRGTADTRVRITGNDITFDGLGATFAENNILSSCTKNWDWKEPPFGYVKPISNPILLKGSIILELYYYYEEEGPEYSSGVIPFVIKAEHVLDFFNKNSTYPIEVIPYTPTEGELPADTYAYQFKAKSLNCEFTIYAADAGSAVSTIIDIAEGTIALSEAVPESGVYGYLTRNVVEPPTIEVTYDSFMQEMTVTAPSGTAVTTTDSVGNVLGSGVTDGTGSVTYKIDEGMLLGGSPITTQAPDSNIVNHNLVASFFVASDVVGQNVEFNLVRDQHLEWLSDYPGNEQGLSATLSGEMIVEYSSGEQHIVNLENYRNQRWGFIVDELGVHDFDVTANPAKVGLVSAKVRFRNLNDKVYIAVSQATHIYKFFDDGVSNVGYQLASRDSRPNVSIKQIPTTLPATVRNLNSMFWGDSDSDFIFADAQVEAALSNWNVEFVESMVSTFSYAKYHALPITDWNPTNLKYLIGTFSYTTSDVAIDWNTPVLIDTSFAFEGPHFTGNVNLTMDNVEKADAMFIDNNLFNQDLSEWCVPKLLTAPADFNRDGILTPEQLPIWGTCPFKGTALLQFKKDASLGNVRVGAVDNYIEVRTYLVNPATGAVVSEIVGSTVTNVPTGEYRLYCKEELLPDNVTIDKLTVLVSGDGLTEISRWSSKPIKECSAYNGYASESESKNLIKVPATRPNTLQTNFAYLFAGASKLNDPNISNWDMSGVTLTNSMFERCAAFNQDLSGWDVSSVTNMRYMFYSAAAFNQPLNGWDVSKVTNMEHMFRSCSNFEGLNIGSWDTSNVKNMRYMFHSAKAFKGDISSWNTANVADMAYMFYNAEVFNADIGQWKVGNVTNMGSMFYAAKAFNYPLTGWCVTLITSKPSSFNSSSALTTINLPVWGTCPNGV